MSPPRLLFADPEGRLYDHPDLLAAARLGEAIGEPDETPVPLPAFGRVTSLPGRLPIGIDPSSGEPVVLDEVTVGRRTFVPTAVGAFLQPGWTRTLLPADELRARFADVGASPIVYCGSGVTACHNLLAMEQAGITGGRLFPGSWSEWSSADRPVATGTEP